MADVAAQDSFVPSASPPRDPDAPRSSADSAAQLGPVEPAQPPAISEELKGRLEKVIYSDV